MLYARADKTRSFSPADSIRIRIRKFGLKQLGKGRKYNGITLSYYMYYILSLYFLFSIKRLWSAVNTSLKYNSKRIALIRNKFRLFEEFLVEAYLVNNSLSSHKASVIDMKSSSRPRSEFWPLMLFMKIEVKRA